MSDNDATDMPPLANSALGVSAPVEEPASLAEGEASMIASQDAGNETSSESDDLSKWKRWLDKQPANAQVELATDWTAWRADQVNEATVNKRIKQYLEQRSLLSTLEGEPLYLSAYRALEAERGELIQRLNAEDSTLRGAENLEKRAAEWARRTEAARRAVDEDAEALAAGIDAPEDVDANELVAGKAAAGSFDLDQWRAEQQAEQDWNTRLTKYMERQRLFAEQAGDLDADQYTNGIEVLGMEQWQLKQLRIEAYVTRESEKFASNAKQWQLRVADLEKRLQPEDPKLVRAKKNLKTSEDTLQLQREKLKTVGAAIIQPMLEESQEEWKRLKEQQLRQGLTLDERLLRDYQRLEKDIKESEEETATLRSSLEFLRKRRTDLQNDSSSSWFRRQSPTDYAKQQRIDTELVQLDGDGEGEGKIAAAEWELHSVEDQLATKRDRFEDYKTKIDEARQRHEAAQAQQRTRQERFDRLTGNLKSLRELEDALLGSAEASQSAVTDEITQLQAKLTVDLADELQVSTESATPSSEDAPSHRQVRTLRRQIINMEALRAYFIKAIPAQTKASEWAQARLKEIDDLVKKAREELHQLRNSQLLEARSWESELNELSELNAMQMREMLMKQKLLNADAPGNSAKTFEGLAFRQDFPDWRGERENNRAHRTKLKDELARADTNSEQQPFFPHQLKVLETERLDLLLDVEESLEQHVGALMRAQVSLVRYARRLSVALSEIQKGATSGDLPSNFGNRVLTVFSGAQRQLEKSLHAVKAAIESYEQEIPSLLREIAEGRRRITRENWYGLGHSWQEADVQNFPLMSRAEREESERARKTRWNSLQDLAQEPNLSRLESGLNALIEEGRLDRTQSRSAFWALQQQQRRCRELQVFLDREVRQGRRDKAQTRQEFETLERQVMQARRAMRGLLMDIVNDTVATIEAVDDVFLQRVWRQHSQGSDERVRSDLTTSGLTGKRLNYGEQVRESLLEEFETLTRLVDRFNARELGTKRDQQGGSILRRLGDLSGEIDQSQDRRYTMNAQLVDIVNRQDQLSQMDDRRPGSVIEASRRIDALESRRIAILGERDNLEGQMCGHAQTYQSHIKDLFVNEQQRELAMQEWLLLQASKALNKSTKRIENLLEQGASANVEELRQAYVSLKDQTQSRWETLQKHSVSTLMQLDSLDATDVAELGMHLEEMAQLHLRVEGLAPHDAMTERMELDTLKNEIHAEVQRYVEEDLRPALTKLAEQTQPGVLLQEIESVQWRFMNEDERHHRDEQLQTKWDNDRASRHNANLPVDRRALRDQYQLLQQHVIADERYQRQLHGRENWAPGHLEMKRELEQTTVSILRRKQEMERLVVDMTVNFRVEMADTSKHIDTVSNNVTRTQNELDAVSVMNLSKRSQLNSRLSKLHLMDALLKAKLRLLEKERPEIERDHKLIWREQAASADRTEQHGDEMSAPTPLENTSGSSAPQIDPIVANLPEEGRRIIAKHGEGDVRGVRRKDRIKNMVEELGNGAFIVQLTGRNTRDGVGPQTLVVVTREQLKLFGRTEKDFREGRDFPFVVNVDDRALARAGRSANTAPSEQRAEPARGR